MMSKEPELLPPNWAGRADGDPDTLWAISQSQSLLQTAVAELCRQRGQERWARSWDVLTRLGPDDDVEAYLHVFEQTARREQWPPAEWGGILGPFLTGEAQQAYLHLPGAGQWPYTSGWKRQSCPTMVTAWQPGPQRYHQWTYDSTLPPWAQVMRLTQLIRSWLEEGDGPGLIERLEVRGAAGPPEHWDLDHPAGEPTGPGGDNGGGLDPQGRGPTQGEAEAYGGPSPNPSQRSRSGVWGPPEVL